MKRIFCKYMGLWLMLLFVAAVADGTYRFWEFVERQHYIRNPMKELEVVPLSRKSLCPDPIIGRLQEYIDCTRMYREDI